MDDELADAIEEAMSVLSPRCREALRLRIFERLMFKDIAKITGVHQSTAIHRYRVAIWKLRSNRKFNQALAEIGEHPYPG